MEKAQNEQLNIRRAELTRKFAIKAYSNERFTHDWFPKKQEIGYGLQRREEIEEKKLNMRRLQNAPVNHLIRSLNREEELPERPI